MSNKPNKQREKRVYDKKWLLRIVKNVWFFPILLAIPFLILTSFKISGTSEGFYNTILYGSEKDTNLIYGQPEPIRSDEWLVTTQLTIAQQRVNYSVNNPNELGGENMSVTGDAPYKDWSSVFRIQYWAFFILPIAYAFALSWWLILYLTIVACYFLILRFLPSKKFAIPFSLAIGCSPFFFWWYDAGTFAAAFYGMFIILASIRVINHEKVRFLSKLSFTYSAIVYALLLIFLAVSFALLLYPPFQIPVAIVVAIVLLAYMLDKYRSLRHIFSREVLKSVAILIISLVISVGFVLAFIKTRSSVIHAIDSTVYPSSRIISPGHTSIQYLLSSYMMPQLQRMARASHYFANQSEASNFILFAPLLIIPSIVLLVIEYRKKHRIDWLLLGIQLPILLFLAYMYVPALPWLYKITFLDKIPHQRLIIGIGIAGALQIVFLTRALLSTSLKKRRLILYSFIYSLACFGVLFWDGLHTKDVYPKFISETWYIAALALIFCIILFCFLVKRYVTGAIILLIFTFFSVYKIDPLYRGLGPLYNSKISRVIDEVSSKNATWGVANDIYFESLPTLSGRKSISGVQLYPNSSLWKEAVGSKDNYIYNRYAHVLFVTSPGLKSPLVLIQTDEFAVNFTCDKFVENNVQFLLSATQLQYSCIKPITTVAYPAITFYIYKVS